MDIKAQTIILNRFEITEKLGSGGMGAIYKAIDRTLQRDVVLKVLHSNEGSGNPKALIRFQNEAKALSRLNHPNIAKVYDFGVLPPGEPWHAQPYLAIEYINGRTFKEIIDQDEPLPILDVVELFMQLADALAHAHKEGVIHRDIKPSNLMLLDGQESTAKLLDFGIAKLEGDQYLTAAGELIGTPFYMSPEQASGTPVTDKSDQYSLGCVLYEMLSGAPPYTGESVMELISKHRSESAPKLDSTGSRQVPARLAQIVEKMLAKEPAERYENMTLLGKDLLQVLEDEVQKEIERLEEEKRAQTEPPLYVAPQKNARLSRRWLAISFAIVAAGFAWMFWRPTNEVNWHDTHIGEMIKTFHAPDEQLMKAISARKTKLIMLAAYKDQKLAPLRGYRYAIDVQLPLSGVTDEGISYLAQSPVRILNLKDSIEIKSLHNVSNLRCLMELNLSGTSIDDESVKSLLNLKMLRSLKLNETKVTERVIDTLKSMPTLTMIALEKNNISGAALRRLSRAMPACQIMPGFLYGLTSESSRASEAAKAKNYAEVVKASDDAIAVIERAQGKDSPAVVPDLLRKASALVMMNRVEDAVPVFDKASNICASYGNDHDLLLAYDGKINALQRLQRHKEAIVTAKKRIACLERIEPPNSDLLAVRLAQLGLEYFPLNQFQDALVYNKRAVACAKEGSGENSIVYAHCLVDLAGTELRLQQIDKSFQDYKQSEAIMARHKASTPLEYHHRLTAIFGIGQCYLMQNKPGLAVKMFEKGLGYSNLCGSEAWTKLFTDGLKIAQAKCKERGTKYSTTP